MSDKMIQYNLKKAVKGISDVLFVGPRAYYCWMTTLTALIFVGMAGYNQIINQGFAATNLRDQVPWGFLIANFTFLIGVAAAAVLLIIPAYLYHFKPIKEIAVLGELMAITALTMALMFIVSHLGRPDRFWHPIPGLGFMNWPASLLAWDMVIINVYMGINALSAAYILWNMYLGKEPNKSFIVPIVIASIPIAISLHTITAFVYSGLSARPFWNASILAPRFLASAFAAGPALMILVFQLVRKTMKFDIDNAAIGRLAQIIAYAMAINLFLLFAELFKEFYSATEHLSSMQYLYLGLDGHNNLVPWIWTATLFNIIGFFIFLIPKFRSHIRLLNIGCGLIIIGVWIEKGMGLIIPGFIPDSLGEIYEYMPNKYEVMIAMGIWAFGALMYTIMVRFAIAVDTGKISYESAEQSRADTSERATISKPTG